MDLLNVISCNVAVSRTYSQCYEDITALVGGSDMFKMISPSLMK
jgi:hypothetical protein